MFGNMRESQSLDHDLTRLDGIVTRYRAAGRSNALLKAVTRAYLGTITVLSLGATFAVLLNFASPFLVLELINFI